MSDTPKTDIFEFNYATSGGGWGRPFDFAREMERQTVRQAETIQMLKAALQAIADEAGQHHEHNPISGVDRLPIGYTKILNLAAEALSSPNNQAHL